MALIVNGVTIPATGTVRYNGTNITRVIYNGVIYWEKSTEITLGYDADPSTQILYFQNKTSGDGSRPTSGGSWYFGGNAENNAFNLEFTLTRTDKPKSATLTIYRTDTLGATKSGRESYLRGGVALTGRGLGTIVNSASSNYTGVTWANGEGFVTVTIPDAVLTQMWNNISGSKVRVGGCVRFVNAHASTTASRPCTLRCTYGV